jgi:hypothetical protein
MSAHADEVHTMAQEVHADAGPFALNFHLNGGFLCCCCCYLGKYFVTGPAYVLIFIIIKGSCLLLAASPSPPSLRDIHTRNKLDRGVIFPLTLPLPSGTWNMPDKLPPSTPTNAVF